MSDPKTLIDSALEGDTRAWGRLVDQYAPLVWSIGRGCGLNREDSEDLAQAVFTTLVRRLPHLQDPSAIVGWIATTAKREAWRMSARNRRSTNLEMGTPEIPLDEPEPDIERLERQQAVREVMLRLDRRCRELLQELFGRAETPSYDELADRLGLSPNSVGPIRRRCLEKVIGELESGSDRLFS